MLGRVIHVYPGSCIKVRWDIDHTTSIIKVSDVLLENDDIPEQCTNDNDCTSAETAKPHQITDLSDSSASSSECSDIDVDFKNSQPGNKMKTKRKFTLKVKLKEKNAECYST